MTNEVLNKINALRGPIGEGDLGEGGQKVHILFIR